MKRVFFRVFLSLATIVAWGQTNYQTGDINDCYTWARWADMYTTLNNINIINGSTVTCNTNVNSNSITLNGNGSISLSGSNSINLSGTTDVKCGGVYGSDKGDGKFKYTYSITCWLVGYNSYSYPSFSITLGPLKRGANYNWAKFRGTLSNFKGGISTCVTCWTSDWNLQASYSATNGITDAITSNIWNNRGRLYTASKCGMNSEIYVEDFGFYNRYFPAGTYITVYLTAVNGPSSGGCCVSPTLYLDLDVQLNEL